MLDLRQIEMTQAVQDQVVLLAVDGVPVRDRVWFSLDREGFNSASR